MQFNGNPVTVINLSEPSDFCCVCGEETWMDHGLPCYEDEIVTSDWQGEWGGFTACEECHFLFSDIKEPLRLLEAKRIVMERRANCLGTSRISSAS
jgi:hypothetical protein